LILEFPFDYGGNIMNLGIDAAEKMGGEELSSQGYQIEPGWTKLLLQGQGRARKLSMI
jgi:hypothetical protein